MSTELLQSTIILSFLTIVFSLSALITILNCIWRSNKHLHRFFVYMLISLGITILRRILSLLGFFQTENFFRSLQYFDVTASFFYLLGALEIYGILRKLDNELPKPKI